MFTESQSLSSSPMFGCIDRFFFLGRASSHPIKITNTTQSAKSDPDPFDYGRNIIVPAVLIIGAGISGTCG